MHARFSTPASQTQEPHSLYSVEILRTGMASRFCHTGRACVASAACACKTDPHFYGHPPQLGAHALSRLSFLRRRSFLANFSSPGTIWLLWAFCQRHFRRIQTRIRMEAKLWHVLHLRVRPRAFVRASSPNLHRPFSVTFCMNGPWMLAVQCISS